MSELKAQINGAVKSAMKAGDKARLARLRMMTAAIKQVEVDERRELSDGDVIAVLDRMAKQRREALQHYHEAGRTDLAEAEQAELDLLAEFLPQPLTDDALDRLIDDAVSQAGASSVKDMGRVMATLKPEVQGRADMSAVSARVKARLSGG